MNYLADDEPSLTPSVVSAWVVIPRPRWWRRWWTRTRSLRRFAVVGGVSRGLQTLFLWLFTEHMGVNYIVSSLIAVGLVFALGYVANRWWTFTKE